MNLEKAQEYLETLEIIMSDSVLTLREQEVLIFHPKREKLLKEIGIKYLPSDCFGPFFVFRSSPNLQGMLCYIQWVREEIQKYRETNNKADLIEKYITKLYSL